jgi:predicted nucleic acid-binding Zn ribbon protein
MRYEYICKECGKIEEVDARLNEEVVVPKCCDKDMVRKYSLGAVLWKCGGQGG